MNNKSALLFVMATLVLITALSVVSATDVVGDDVATADISQTDDTSINSNVNDVSSSQGYVQADTDKQIIKNDKQTKAEAKTIVVNNKTFKDYFNEGYLNDKVSAGDTLDMQGNFLGEEFQMFIDKPVNMISSTQDVNITLNTTATSYFGDEDVVSFTVKKGGSGSNITGLYFYNTQLFLRNVHDVVLKNVTSIIDNRQVGSGVGQTSIRDNSTNVTIDSCKFFTHNNGGSSSLVLAWATNCMVKNNFINASGMAGNCLYLTTYNVEGINENITGATNNNNTLLNNTIYGTEEVMAICYGIAIEGADNKVLNNTIYYGGQGITTQWMSNEESKSFNTTIIGNKLLNGSNLVVPDGGVVSNNTITGNLRTTPGDAIVENNTINNVTLTNNTDLINNHVLSDVYISALTENMTIANNTIDGKIVTTGRFTSAKNSPKYLIIENNTVNGINMSGLNASVIRNNNLTKQILFNGTRNGYINLTIENNTIVTDDEYAIYLGKALSNVTIDKNKLYAKELEGNDAIYQYDNVNATIGFNEPFNVNLTNANYPTYFDEDGVSRSEVFTGHITLHVAEDLLNKSFIFNNADVELLNENNYTLYNATIDIQNGSKVVLDSLKIVTAENEGHVILINSTGNTLRNIVINATNTENIHAIEIEDDQNVIMDSVINVVAPAFDTVYNPDYSIGTVPTAGIFIRSSDNSVINTSVTLKANGTKSPFSSIDGVDVQSKNVGEFVTGNTFRNDTITVSGAPYTYGLNVARAGHVYTEDLIVNVDSNNYAIGVQIADTKNSSFEANVTAKADYQVYGGYITAMATGTTDNVTFDNFNVETNGKKATSIATDAGNEITITNSKLTNTNTTQPAIYIAPDYLQRTPSNIMINNVTVVEDTKVINVDGSKTTSPSAITIVKADNATIVNSSISTNSENGVCVTSSSNALVDSNYINATNGSSVLVEKSKNVNVTNNALYTNSNVGDASVTTVDSNKTIVKDNNNLDVKLNITGDLRVNIPSNITVAVTTEDGKPINVGTVDVIANGQKIKATLQNGVATAVYKPKNTGDVNVTAVYTSPNTLAMTTNTTLPVTENTYITINPITCIVNEPVTIVAVIKTETNKTLNEGKITFTDKKGTVLGVVNIAKGKASLNHTYNATGSQVVVAKFNGTDKLNPSTANTTVTVRKLATNITLSNVTAIVGEPVSIVAVIKTENNTALNEGKITFTDKKGTVLGVVNIVKGKASLNHTYNATGSQVVVAKFNATAKYNSSVANATVSVRKVATNVTVNNIIGKVNDKVTIKATVVGENKKPVNSGNVIFKVNGTTLKDANGSTLVLKVNNGSASTTMNAPKSWANRNLSLVAVYNGNDVYNRSESKAGRISITNHDANLTILTNSMVARGGQMVQFIVIVSEDSRLVNGGSVIFKLNGETIKDAAGKTVTAKVVNGVGMVNYTIPEGISAKNLTLTSVYSASGYNRVEGNGSLFIEKSNVYIVSEPVKTKTNTTKFSARILNLNNLPIKGNTMVSIKVNGVTVGSTTAVNGVINTTIKTPFKAGTYDLQIIAGQNNRYNAAKATTALVINR